MKATLELDNIYCNTGTTHTDHTGHTVLHVCTVLTLQMCAKAELHTYTHIHAIWSVMMSQSESD